MAWTGGAVEIVWRGSLPSAASKGGVKLPKGEGAGLQSTCAPSSSSGEAQRRPGDPSSSSGRSKIGPGEAPKAICSGPMSDAGVRERVLLTQAAGSPGLRREGAACARMTKGGEGLPGPVPTVKERATAFRATCRLTLR